MNDRNLGGPTILRHRQTGGPNIPGYLTPDPNIRAGVGGGGQLYSDTSMCKCECRSNSPSTRLPKYPLSTWQVPSVTPSLLLSACSVAQKGDQRVEVNRSPLNTRTHRLTHRQMNSNYSRTLLMIFIPLCGLLKNVADSKSYTHSHNPRNHAQ